MGELKVSRLTDVKDKANYIHQLIKDIEALEIMINDGLIEKSPIRVGAEQEFCLVNHEYCPNSNALDILKDINDNHFTTEIGKYNLELNLDPFELKSDCFSKLNGQLNSLLGEAKKVAKRRNTKIILTGILPTIATEHIQDKYMTPVERYYILNEALKESRKEHFNIHIKGADEINLLHHSVLLEGCNTSFQVHLQINPEDFIESYNWAQAISGPVLSACTNSPMLFGKELWCETRIALFTQSVDTRANSFHLNEKQPRVSFGKHWATGSIIDIFKDNISRFRSLVTAEFTKDSVEMLANGETPNLKALNLHNGIVYLWNRPCYGVGNGKPHLRIENRYLPSGPTIVDEIANTVFWVGLMVGKPERYNEIHNKMDFNDAKVNFFNAAKDGLGAQFYWNAKYLPSHKLILKEFLPLAYEGLDRYGVNRDDANYYLSIIEERVKSHNGSRWAVKSYRNLLKSRKSYEAAQILVSEMYKNQESKNPVSKWEIIERNKTFSPIGKTMVMHKMTTDIFTVNDNDSIELVLNIMKWKNIHHLPVINNNEELVGLLTWKDVKTYLKNSEEQSNSVGSIMKKELYTISQYDTIYEAKRFMQKYKIKGLPVVDRNKLIGLITTKDI